MRPVHTLSILSASVSILNLKEPCIFAANSSFGMFLVLVEVEEVDKASLVNRSDMAFNWMSDGRITCASGSRTRGSWIPSTLSAVNTLTGISCVTIVSLSLPPPAFKSSSLKALSPNGSSSRF